MTDNGADDDGAKYDYLTLSLEVRVSTTGLEDSDFTSVGVFKRKYDGKEFEWRRLADYVNARYVKLLLLAPCQYNGNWGQLVEFQVHDGATKRGASPALAENRELCAVPESTQLFEAYPNPFNPQTTIEYKLEKDSRVLMQVFDLNGRKVATLIDDYQAPGAHQMTWQAGSYASGTYFIVLNAGQTQRKIKVLFLK